jgi:hypothetical protein
MNEAKELRNKYGHAADVGDVTVSKKDMCLLLDLAEMGQKALELEDGKAVAVCGNFTEGYSIVGPYPSWDIAAIMHPGPDVWIATLEEPPDMNWEKEVRSG